MKNFGFTLAEVLITLGVIGVVAAMTMPVLLQNYRNHVVETRLKKFYSVFNQAIQSSIADNGDFTEWDYFDKRDEEAIELAFDKYLRPYLKITDTKKIPDKGLIVYYLSDGSAFAYSVSHNRDIMFFPNASDKNLQNFSNSDMGVSVFKFCFMPNDRHETWKYHYKKGLEPLLYDWDGDENTLYSGKDFSCRDGSVAHVYCTAIIQHNGWKIPKDYPKKVKL